MRINAALAGSADSSATARARSRNRPREGVPLSLLRWMKGFRGSPRRRESHRAHGRAPRDESGQESRGLPRGRHRAPKPRRPTLFLSYRRSGFVPSSAGSPATTHFKTPVDNRRAQRALSAQPKLTTATFRGLARLLRCSLSLSISCRVRQVALAAVRADHDGDVLYHEKGCPLPIAPRRAPSEHTRFSADVAAFLGLLHLSHKVYGQEYHLARRPQQGHRPRAGDPESRTPAAPLAAQLARRMGFGTLLILRVAR